MSLGRELPMATPQSAPAPAAEPRMDDCCAPAAAKADKVPATPAMSGPIERTVVRVTGMDCAEEIAILKREVGPLVGGEDRLGFDLLRAKMTVVLPAGVDAGAVRCAPCRDLV